MGENDSSGDPLSQLQQKYAEIYVILYEHVGTNDPRSYDRAVARMEESLMWAIKGMKNSEQGGNN